MSLPRNSAFSEPNPYGREERVAAIRKIITERPPSESDKVDHHIILVEGKILEAWYSEVNEIMATLESPLGDHRTARAKEELAEKLADLRDVIYNYLR